MERLEDRALLSHPAAAADAADVLGMYPASTMTVPSNDAPKAIPDNDPAGVTSVLTGRICGSKFNDLNGDRVRDPGEPLLPNWIIYLDENNDGRRDPGERFEVTDAAGNYCFSNLPPGDYTVAEIQQNGWEQTFPAGAVPNPVQLVGNWNGHLHEYGDVWGEGNYAYLGHFDLAGGVDIIDISDPARPTLVTAWQGSAGGNQIKDVKVRGGIGFFASDRGGGVYIVDLTDPAAPVELARITSAIGGFDSVHNVSIDGDYLYEADSRTPDVHVFNISNPASPAFVRTITSPSGDAVHDVTAQNGRLYTSVIEGAGGTDIFDVGNVANSAPLLGSFDSGGSTHSNWPTADGNYLAVARETGGGGVKIWNVSNPANVTLAATLDPEVLGIDAISAHNPVIDGNLLYVSWYQAGVYVFDILDPTNPVLLGSYDTFPGPVSGFDGNWGVYPIPGTDRVLASDLQTGLYVLSLYSRVTKAGSPLTGTAVPGTHTVVLDPGDVVTGRDFGNRQTIPATISGRHVFYDNSAFDNDAGPDVNDFRAIASDKLPLLPGETADRSNYTSYSRGINGIMVDVDNLPAGASPSAADFLFAAGNDNLPAGWSPAPPPSSVTLWPGAGTGGSDRIKIIWPDGMIEKQWLQVTVRVTPNTGLTTADVFYYGNTPGEAGDNPINTIVNATDEIAAHNFQHSAADPALIDDPYDYDRDGLVNGTDQIIARNNQTNPLTMLRLIEARAVDAGLEQLDELGGDASWASATDLDWLYELERMNAKKQTGTEDRSNEAIVDMLLAADWS
ncbi:MAG: hypothetical protein V3R99_00865 [Thermoguttaceae bacterium]